MARFSRLAELAAERSNPESSPPQTSALEPVDFRKHYLEIINARDSTHRQKLEALKELRSLDETTSVSDAKRAAMIEKVLDSLRKEVPEEETLEAFPAKVVAEHEVLDDQVLHDEPVPDLGPAAPPSAEALPEPEPAPEPKNVVRWPVDAGQDPYLGWRFRAGPDTTMMGRGVAAGRSPGHNPFP
jgi:hypothetical protein